MINKIERLVSIGKYRNYQTAGIVNFKKLTLLYGDNGGGKTTLTSVIRSLTNNDPEIIRSRKSTNAIEQQAAQISYSNGTITHYTFHHANGWTAQLPNVEIFDIHFVTDNVYSGFEVTDDHKKQLHKFVVGAQGILIQEEIERNKAAKTVIRNRKIEYDRQLMQLVENGLTANLITNYIRPTTPRPATLDSQITVAETALINANATAVIQTLQPLSPLQRLITHIDFANITADLQATTQTLQDVLLQELFDSHSQDLTNNNIDGASNWLRTGYRFIETKQLSEEHINHQELDCPFCKQHVQMDSDIIRSYVLRFNEEFNAFILRLQGHLTQVRAFNLEAAILTINNVNEINDQRVTTWIPHLRDSATTPVFNIIPNEDDLRNRYQALIVSLEQKIQSPSQVASITTITEFQQLGATINQNINIYNQQITNYNTAITAFRTRIRSVSDAQAELQRLRRLERRYLPEVDTICTAYNNDNQTLRTLETEYSQLSARQVTDTNAFFVSYKDRINHYLTSVFRTLFRIEDVRHIAPVGRSIENKLGYKLTIDGHDISFLPNQPLSSRECLSEGDKSTIALAFFLSKLDIDAGKANKIMVFDDPLSSLDTNRRTYTVNIIRQLMSEMKQVIVLSHNEYFLHELSRHVRPENISTLRITENFVAKASVIESCNLEELAKSDYFKQIEYLEAFRLNPNHAIKDSVLGWLRTVLEAHLRFKFYREIRGMGGDKTFGALIRFLNDQVVTFRDTADRSGVIASLNMINNVSWVSHHGTPMPDFNALGYNPMTITAAELDHLIVDTLDLINRRL